MNPMTNVKNVQKYNNLELERGIAGTDLSWHHQYKDSAWIFIGGLNYDLTEGDVVCVFSQYGEIVNVNLVRDKKTGKSKGFAFLCYENQKSTILAVDNFNGIKLTGRTIRVDHVEEYKVPKDVGTEDETTMKIREEGIHPTAMAAAPKDEDDDDEDGDSDEALSSKKDKKKKKKKKKMKKQRQSSDSENDDRHRRGKSSEKKPIVDSSRDFKKESSKYRDYDEFKSEVKREPPSNFGSERRNRDDYLVNRERNGRERTTNGFTSRMDGGESNRGDRERLGISGRTEEQMPIKEEPRSPSRRREFVEEGNRRYRDSDDHRFSREPSRDQREHRDRDRSRENRHQEGTSRRSPPRHRRNSRSPNDYR